MPGFTVAILLCFGDNCDLVRVEPDVAYPTYEACSAAVGKNAAKIGEIVGRVQREAGRQGDIICLREQLTLVELDEEHEALAPVAVREEPAGSARAIGTIARGQKVTVTGRVAGTGWFRVALPDGRRGYAYGERLRKVALAAEPSRVGEATPPPPARTGSSAAQTPAGEAAAPPQAAAIAPPVPGAPPAPPPGARPLQEFRSCDQCPLMVALPAGRFEMGSTADPSERPAHRVGIAAVAIGKFEVTQGEWNFCVTAGGCAYKPRNPSADEQSPMTNLSWDDAGEYVEWLRRVTGQPYRLPSEAEWEYAARAGTVTPYPWGREIGVAKANCRGCGGSYDPSRPAAVGSFPPNPWGLHDMLGGVAEWTDDCWHKSYDGAPADGSSRQAARCAQRVLRGGSWKNPPEVLTVSIRNFYDASVRYIANGLRVALSLR